jgi:hypothetical protein
MRPIIRCLIDSNDVDLGNINDICKHALKHNRTRIVKALTKRFPSLFSKQDIDQYEGGIDTWFGVGSVMCYELGCAMRISYGPEDATILEVLG